MGRAPQYSAPAILDAAARLAAASGPDGVTISAIADAIGASSGSIYHRFRSKDLLLAELWLQTIQAFQEGFRAALTGPEPRTAGLAAALHTVYWVREHPIPARLLLLHDRDDFLPDGWPPDIADRAAQLTSQTTAALRSFTRRALGSTNAKAVRRTRYAVIDLSYAAVTPHVRAGETPPPSTEELVTAAYFAVMPGPLHVRDGRGL